jgi:hypothetical protein
MTGLVSCTVSRDAAKAAINPLYKSKKLDEAGAKWVLGKVVAKVMDKTMPEQLASGRKFVSDSRAAKVQALVEAYAADWNSRRAGEQRGTQRPGAPR